tara:strand:- start:578 stop:1036 length:459 start_codon:yes stop_codon:yes gene_type:complete
MARIDYAISLSAIQSTTHEGVTVENLDAEIGRSLGGGNSSTTWAGDPIATPDWTAANGCIHYASGDSNNTFSVGAAADGLWIKHTGFNFDAGVTPSRLGTTANTALVTVTGANDIICKLKAGEAIFLPQPLNQTITFSDNGTAAAMEVVVLT